VHVLFVEPAFPANQRQFVRGLAEVGARVTGIGEAPFEALPDSIRNHLHGYEQVRSVVHEHSLAEAVRAVQRRSWVDRLEATVEAHVMTTARVREACGIPGTSVETAFLCRDKPAMKEFLRRAGVPCAQSTGASRPEEVREFAARVGLPLILKPPAGAGAAGTTRVDDEAELEAAIAELGIDGGASVAVEEFIDGHEGFYDTITIGGSIAHEFITHYYPRVLTAMRERSIAPIFVATNRMDAPGYDEVKRLGARVIEALGLGTSATHMEWFYGEKGLKFSEIGCRPPGVGAWDLYCAGNDMDLYREWAAAIVLSRPTQRPSRRFAAGIVNLRPDRDGRIVAYEGIEEMQGALAEWLIDYHFPPVGSRTQPVEAGYMANAWVRLKHPDYDEARRLLELVGRSVRVRAA
jgi:formate-dependent phosphoribosylglycinamide formyltransferase (GAR transformylase)